MSQFKLGESGGSDMVCAVFLQKAKKQERWYPVDTSEVVPVNDPSFRWVPVGKCTWHRVHNNNDDGPTKRPLAPPSTAKEAAANPPNGAAHPPPRDDEISDADCTTSGVKPDPDATPPSHKGIADHTDMSEMLSPGGTLEEDVEEMLLDHYYRLEITEVDSGVATLKWHFPPAIRGTAARGSVSTRWWARSRCQQSFRRTTSSRAAPPSSM